jgi:hypothetical protein
VPLEPPVDGAPVGDWLGAPPVGVSDGLPLGLEPAGEPVVGWADGLFDGFFPPGAAFELVAPGVATVLGPVPPAGPVVRTAPDVLRVGTWPVVGASVVEDPAGAWFAVGAPLNAPETSSATRPTQAKSAAPTAIAVPVRRRGLGRGAGPGCPWAGGGPVGSDMRCDTLHSSEP